MGSPSWPVSLLFLSLLLCFKRCIAPPGFQKVFGFSTEVGLMGEGFRAWLGFPQCGGCWGYHLGLPFENGLEKHVKKNNNKLEDEWPGSMEAS